MKEQFLSQENKHATLKKKFLKGIITALDFRDEILRLDQEGNHTENAEENIKLLEDIEIIKKTKNLGPEILKSYNNLLALSYFHKGQGVNDGESFNRAEEILRDIEKDDWYYYVLGTKFYFENNLEELKDSLTHIKNIDNTNYQILQRLIQSLKKGEDPKTNYQKNLFK